MITRIYPFERFIQILVERKFCFISPTKWEDPWEARLYMFDQEGERTCVLPIFGSCWSLNDETDFSWRAYSPNKNGILVKSDEVSIVDYFEKEIKNSYPFSEVEGRSVEYLSNSEFTDRISNFHRASPYFSGHDGKPLKTFFLKRQFFANEKEYRIMVNVDLGRYFYEEEVITVNFDPNVYFSEIILDPRLPKEDFESFSRLIKKLGFAGAIKRSLIYQNP